MWLDVLEAHSPKIGATMAKTKKIVRREWTKDDVRTLKTMARKTPITKIAKVLKRTPAATQVKASALGVSLDTRG
jgi:hypothetical protein